MNFGKRIIVAGLFVSMVCLPQTLLAKDKDHHDKDHGKDRGGYIAGDFHNHTAFTDGATSIDMLTDEAVGEFGLDWFVQSGHGGGWSRDGRYDDWNYDCGADGEGVNWEDSGVVIKGDSAGTGYCGKLNMWRWQSLMEYAYPTTKAKYVQYQKPIIQGYEFEVPGHEHCSHANITGQFDAGNADALAQFEYLFNYTDKDMSGGAGWPGKIANIPNGPGAGGIMHEKAVAAVEWLQAKYPTTSYVVWAHIERKGAFDPDKAYSTGYNVEHFRDFNNAGPDVAFGFEGEPGHQASGSRGGFGGGAFGGGTYGGVGYYSATIGNIWDALLGEGRNWWYYGSSDWHNRGSFLPTDVESTNDFWPGEFQKTYIYVDNTRHPKPQDIIDGLRSGNAYVVQGDLIEDLQFTAKAKNKTATMGQKLQVKAGEKVQIKIKVRDPKGPNNCPYTFYNPSLEQVGLYQPLNEPVLDHIDMIAGEVTGKIDPADPNYKNPENPTAGVIARFERQGGPDKNGYMTYVYHFKADKSMYFRLRGTNMPVNTPNETDPEGNPLPDTMAGNIACDNCPPHVAEKVNYDVEAWSDLWFTSNPIFVMVH
ncbi:MAG: hypothetical protein V2I40_01870 [Desulfobacteraceae bacterium]|nr:hypothetical protein [Desulfobacteraceae bacterium]